MNVNNEYDSIMADGKWTFNEAVSNCFDNMLERSIPGYDRMRSLVYSFGKNYVQSGTYIIDIGCSLGNAIFPFIDEFQDKCKYIGIEKSIAMVKKFNDRFYNEIKNGLVKIFNTGVEDYYPIVNASLVLSVLTLQFIPKQKRQLIINQVFNSLIPNGAFILVEKTQISPSTDDDLFKKIYYELKKQNGYSTEQILNKESSLKDTLVPLTREENVHMLREAGFKRINCFWSDIMFVAWIAVKE